MEMEGGLSPMKMTGSRFFQSKPLYWKVLILVPLIILSFVISWHYRLRSTVLYQLFKPGLDAKAKQDALVLLDAVSKTLEAHNLTYMLHGGTLLGAYRHGGFIPWDDDLDLLLDSKQQDKLWPAIRTLEPTYKHVKHYFDKVYKYYPDKKQIRFTHTWPYADLIFYTDNGTHIFAEDKYCWSKEAVFPLKRRWFESRFLPVPKETESFIAEMYSTDIDSICKSKPYNHYWEVHLPDMSVPCELLYEKYPFIHRSKQKDGTMEVLKIGDKVLNTHLVTD